MILLSRSILFVFVLTSHASLWAYQNEGLPRTFIARSDILLDAKKRIAANDQTIQPFLMRLMARADKALQIKAVSVMDKTEIPPSGSKHDFMCPAPLWWPDPDQPNGLPYVWNREGKINPEYYRIGDQVAFDRMADAVQTLALVYYLTSDEKYAEKAGTLIRVWFLDSDTRMNPNLKFAWFERGRNNGTSFGIKSMEKLPFVIDAVGMLASSSYWNSKVQEAMKAWAATYLDWLLTGQRGSDAALIWNRFGTVYDVQAVSCALFTGRIDLAKQILEAAKVERITRHVRRDGRQPYDLEREITFMNSVESVGYLFQLATLGELVDIDLWNYVSPEGGSIRKALDFVAPYADPAKKWPYILEVNRELLRPVLQQAAVVYDDDEYLLLLQSLMEARPDETSDEFPVYALYVAGRHIKALEMKPRLFIFNLDVLKTAKQRIRDGDPSYEKVLEELRKEAEMAMEVPATSVMDKRLTPPSGDKHDFMSIGGYYWPDSTKADGMPWIYRDGKPNPDRDKYGDFDRFFAVTHAAYKLGLAYYITDDERCAKQAAHLIRTWFLDPGTRMNPNLRYAHAQPGVMEGSYYGIIQTRIMPELVDAIGMMAESAAWKSEDQYGMVLWLAEFLHWMLNDEEAQEEGRVWNNHSSNYDVTSASFALFAGKRGTARRILESAKKRIPRQIRPDGRMPFELERNRPWVYAVANLDRFLRLATMGEHVGVELWNYVAPNGSSIRKAIDYLAFYVKPENEWPYADLNFQDESSGALARFRPILLRAAMAYDDPNYFELVRLMPADVLQRRDRDLVYIFYHQYLSQ